jgi:hypothetical protein
VSTAQVNSITIIDNPSSNWIEVPNELPFRIEAPVIDVVVAENSVRAFKSRVDLRLPNPLFPDGDRLNLRSGLLMPFVRALERFGIEVELSRRLPDSFEAAHVNFDYAPDFSIERLPRQSLDFLNSAHLGVLEYSSRANLHDFLSRMPATRQGTTVVLTSSQAKSRMLVSLIRSRSNMPERVLNWHEPDAFGPGPTRERIRRDVPFVIVGTPGALLDNNETPWERHCRAFFVTDVSLLSPWNRIRRFRSVHLRHCLDSAHNPARIFLLLDSKVTCKSRYLAEIYEYGGMHWGYLAREGMICDGPSVERPNLRWRVSGGDVPKTEVDVARAVDRSNKRMRALHAWLDRRIPNAEQGVILLFPRQETVELFHRLHAGYQSFRDIFTSSHLSRAVFTMDELERIHADLIQTVVWGGARSEATDFYRSIHARRFAPDAIRVIDPVDIPTSNRRESQFLQGTLNAWSVERECQYRKMGYRAAPEDSVSFHVNRAFGIVIRPNQPLQRGGA